MPGDHISEPMPAAPLRVGGGAKLFFALIVLAILGKVLAGPYVDWLWYLKDAKQPEVYLVELKAKSVLLSFGFLASVAFLGFNFVRSMNLTMVFQSAPENPAQAGAVQLLSALQVYGKRLAMLVAPIAAYILASGLSGEWNTFLLASHSQPFGKVDPTFGKDLSFFVFQLPWFEVLANTALTLALLAAAVSVGASIGFQTLAKVAGVQIGRPATVRQSHWLISLVLLLLGVRVWIDLYTAGLVENKQFTGIGYAGTQSLAVQKIVAILFVIGAAVTFINSFKGKGYRTPILVGVGTLAVWFLGGAILPSLTQRLIVDPDRLHREAPFAEHAIAMTRFGYDLDRIEIRDVVPNLVPTAVDVKGATSTLDNMRLWDPAIFQTALGGLQAIRPYYSFSDVDIDRYTIDGKPRLVMLAPRQLDLDGLDPSARNWTNERLRYTHGYGVAVARVDQSSPDGAPVFLGRDIPQVNDPVLPPFEPRIYYGDARDQAGNPIDEYALVDSGEPELDYSSPNGTNTHRWQGDAGIPVGGILNRAVLSLVLGDGNLLVSPQVQAKSRLLMHRQVVERAKRIFPFLTIDPDPYAVLADGRVFFVLDGYTTSDHLPYSANSGVSYIRNSVKITIDAYSGATVGYQMLADEPILKAYASIYPGLFQPIQQMPASLRVHLRYPDLLVNLQSKMLQTYHVVDPTVFLSNGDAWHIAQQRGLDGRTESIKPFFVEMELPGERKSQFVSILPFTPSGRINMTAWLAAQSDGVNYGKAILFRFSSGTPIAGPEQMEAKFTSTPEISNINRQFQNDQSDIVVGNLLTIPLGKSFLYAESLFLQPKTQGLQKVPRLTKVILALNDRVVVGDTYQQALKMLFGETPEAAEPTPTPGAIPAATTAPLAQAKAALELLDQADAKLRAGDFAAYGKLQTEARAKLRSLIAK